MLENLRHDTVPSKLLPHVSCLLLTRVAEGGIRQAEVYNKAELRSFVAEYLPMLAALLRCECASEGALELAIGFRKDFVDLWDKVSANGNSCVLYSRSS